jgi:CRP-like cAMP-binding protein
MDTTRLFRNANNTLTLDPSHVIFREKDPGDLMYVVLEGEVEILVGERIIETIGVGGIFGEIRGGVNQGRCQPGVDDLSFSLHPHGPVERSCRARRSLPLTSASKE